MTSLLTRAATFIGRIQALGVKESALRYYRTGDIHQLYGDLVGVDTVGNRYYQAIPGTAGMGRDRWVWYTNKNQEPSTIAPEWHSWLHHLVDEIPTPAAIGHLRPHYMKSKAPNMTGTDAAYSSNHYIGNKNFKPTAPKVDTWKPAPKSASDNPSEL